MTAHPGRAPSTSPWTVGAATVVKVFEMLQASDSIYDLLNVRAADLDPHRRWLRPYLGQNDEMLLSVHSFCIQADGQRIVVDTCIGNDRRFEAPMIAKKFNGLHTNFLEDMAAAGFPAESVDIVICTHLHQDHIGYNTLQVNGRWRPTFANACYIMSARDHELWRAGFAGVPQLASDFALAYSCSIGPLVETNVVKFVSGEYQVTPSVSLIPTPGHTPGHFSVEIKSEGKVGIITGDTFHSPVQFAHPDWAIRVDTDSEESARSRRALIDLIRRTDATVFGTHFPGASVGRVRSIGDEFYFE